MDSEEWVKREVILIYLARLGLTIRTRAMFEAAV